MALEVDMLTLLFSMSAFGATWVVDIAGGGDFTSIQDAIDAAAKGDTIEVAPGTYAEAIDFGGLDVAVIGRDGSAETTLDGDGIDAWAVRFEAGESSLASLEGFTVTNVTGFGGVLVSGANPSLVDLVLDDISQTATPAMLVEDGSPLIKDCQFSYNEGASDGPHHLYLFNSSATIEGSSFVGDPDEPGVGVRIDGDCKSARTITFTDTAFVGHNYSLEQLGCTALVTEISRFEGAKRAALVLLPGSYTDTDSVFASNNAAIDAQDVDVFLTGTQFLGNTGEVSPSSIAGFLYDSKTAAKRARFVDVLFEDNTGSTVLSSSILSISTGSATAPAIEIVDSEFDNNSAYWGALRISGVATVDNTVFSDNSGGEGAMYVLGYATVTDSTFTSNHAEGRTSSGRGAAIHLEESLLTKASGLQIDGCTFDGNTSDGFAAIFVLDGYTEFADTTVSINDSAFTNNQSPEYGAIYAQEVESLLISGGSHFEGHATGAVYAEAGFGSVVESSFVDNGNTNGAAALHLLTLDKGVELQGCTFSGNVGSEGGAVNWDAGGQHLSVLNSDFDGNQTTVGGGGALSPSYSSEENVTHLIL